MNYQDITSLIKIRDFANYQLENIQVKLSREEVRGLQSKIAQLNKILLDQILTLDLEPKKIADNVTALSPGGFLKHGVDEDLGELLDDPDFIQLTPNVAVNTSEKNKKLVNRKAPKPVTRSANVDVLENEEVSFR